MPCIGCNTCVNLPVHREVAGCAANPLTTYEASRVFEPVTAPQRAPIVGGGVAGMHAARFLALQGHEVTLCEAGDRLGGQLNACCQTLPDYGLLADWLARQLNGLGGNRRFGYLGHGRRRSRP